ncbi:MAG: cysteate synthase [Nitrospirae bacterium]|nr:cysteate synthase [Nitrospirota bacterium]
MKEVYCALCAHCADALLVSEYRDPFQVDDLRKGIWKFNWLPVHSPEFVQPGPVVYKSQGLSSRLGLSGLYIAFNGWWPERGAEVKTCTFKEFEAAVVLQNAMENGMPGLTVASAGNTARAFCHLSPVCGFPVIIVVPGMCIVDMWYPKGRTKVPTLVVSDGDYADSIDVAKRVALISGWPFEGGVNNISKRDGLGVVLLEAVACMGRLPDCYFQAVGSGAGAVGVSEMAARLVRDGRFGAVLPKLHLAQNIPFTPMVNAWNKGSRTLFSEDLNPDLICEITTRVLSSRYPAYSVRGGLYDALAASGGAMYGVTNEEVYEAQEIFMDAEGIDIGPAAGVAVAALINAARSNKIRENDTILLNITGGGEKKFAETHKTYKVEPVLVTKDISDADIESLLCQILKKN